MARHEQVLREVARGNPRIPAYIRPGTPVYDIRVTIDRISTANYDRWQRGVPVEQWEPYPPGMLLA